MIIADNGSGFDTESAGAVSSKGLGVQSIRERAAMMNGAVHFTSEGKGTRILMQIPLIDQDVQPRAGRRKS